MAVEKSLYAVNDDEPMDGPVDVVMPGEDLPEEVPAAAPADHRDNLADLLTDDELNEIATYITDCYRADKDSRQDWLKTYKKGLDFLGFSLEDRDKPFKGASGVFHPIMAEAVIRFQSNAIMEIFPASGPVLTNVMGDETPEKIKQAKRVKEEFNYQLTDNMAEYRTETEQLLFRLPLAGSVFKKVYFDPLKKRPSSCMIPAEDVIVNYGASELENVERIFHVMKRSTNEIKKLQRSQFYRECELQKPVQDIPEGKRKEDKVMGVTPSPEHDNRHILIEAHIHYNLPGPFEDSLGIADPYVITLEEQSNKILSIYRNWAEEDGEDRKCEQYFVHYQYMPGLGFYGLGLAHVLGSIAKAATSITRQLIDAGTLSNLPAGLKTKGLRMKGEDTPLQPGEWRDVDVAPGALGDNFYPLPYKEPSQVLVGLLQMLVEEGRRIGSIADVEISSAQANAPVGTTMALMERSLKVMTAVHARLHASLRKELKLIGRVIHDYMPPQYEWDLEGKYNRQEDFDRKCDVIPVSDPNAATQAQRIVQLQAVQQLAQMNPEIYNLKELHRDALNTIGIKDTERILPMDNPPPPLDPVQENMAVLTAQPVKVYPEQDHTAHIQVHLSFMTDPKILEMVGQSPNAVKLQGQMEAHVAEHLAFQYREEIQQIMGVELPPIGESLPPEIENHLSRLVADASIRLREKHEAEAAKKQAEEIAADPVYQLRKAEVEIKGAKVLADATAKQNDQMIEVAKEASKEAMDLRRLQSEEERAAAKIGADLITWGAELTTEQRREGLALGKELGEEFRKDMITVKQMDDENAHRIADRQAQLQIARLKKPKAPAKK
jgi:hypothetical protein